jgi:TetR/AcrR family transcriptional repressor of bet genes
VDSLRLTAVTPRAPGAPTPVRTRAEKYDERRNQLAESALATLGELGYARTSLREIAQNSEFSHGVVHYYFANKIELITYCVRYYKATCVTRYDDLVATATTAEELAVGFADKLVETIADEAPMHRLWYDLRTQAMFEPELREAVLEIDHTLELMIWRIVRRYADLRGGEPVFSSATTYALFDGLFEKGLLSYLSGDPVALDDLRARALAVGETVVR